MLLEIRDLSIRTANTRGSKPILTDVNVTVQPDEIVALVGGSGSGKTTTGLAVMGLLDPGLRLTGGEILFEEGPNLLTLPAPAMRRIRGTRISMVFQDPLSAFNPVLTIGFQIDEVMKCHGQESPARIRSRTLQGLDKAGIPDPARVYASFPHQLSGGMRQRAMITMAMAMQPRLIIADEPTSNLDVTLQARILELFQAMRASQKVSILFITHDLGLVRRLCDRVYVMSKGRVVEDGLAQDVFAAPREEYTRQLLKAVGV